jgi:hypothetical protein
VVVPAAAWWYQTFEGTNLVMMISTINRSSIGVARTLETISAAWQKVKLLVVPMLIAFCVCGFIWCTDQNGRVCQARVSKSSKINHRSFNPVHDFFLISQLDLSFRSYHSTRCSTFTKDVDEFLNINHYVLGTLCFSRAKLARARFFKDGLVECYGLVQTLAWGRVVIARP